VICFFASTTVKHMFGYDDSLDAFGVHAIGGIVGAVLTGVFARAAIGGAPTKAGLIEGHPEQVMTQLYGIGVTLTYTAIGTLIILKVIDVNMGLRVDEEAEREGLDVSQHGEVVL